LLSRLCGTMDRLWLDGVIPERLGAVHWLECFWLPSIPGPAVSLNSCRDVEIYKTLRRSHSIF
jgi:hypothetical protein